MNKRTTAKVVSVALLASAFTGIGTAAQAVWYPPGTNIWISASKKSPLTYVVTVGGGVFGAGKKITIKIPKSFKFKFGEVATPGDDLTWTVTTNAEGGIDPFTIEVPEELAGTFTVTAVDESDTAVSSTFSVNNGTPMIVTGGPDGATIGLYAAGAAVLLAGGALAVGASRNSGRRNGLAA